MKFRRTVLPLAIAASISVLLLTRTYAGTPEQDTKNYTQTPSLEEYRPRSTLVIREHKIERARFPFIDIHSHHANPTAQHVDQLVKEMDTINLRVIVNLSGGAQGLKIFKNFGMDVKYAGGQRVHVDDPEFDPVWDKCAELGIPVLIHIAEPAAFFDPWDYHNERWLELKQFPGRARPPDKYPPFETLIVERNRLFAKHPKTNFIAAHLAFHGNDLERLGETLDALPNMYVDIAAVLAELGRQPYSAHDFLVKYQDRVLMGKDIYEVSEYKWYFRALETRDEYFEYYRPRHAFWRIYGFQVPDEVLKKVYYQNALKLVPGIDRKAFPD